MAGGTDRSGRRLSAAALKVDQFLQHLDRVADSVFPHDDGRTALRDIRTAFEAQRELQSSIPEGASPDITDQFLREVRDLVRMYTRVLGIILRSTNLRNNFEIYFPLKKLAKQFLGDDVRLLISSEWDFIPFTYPMSFEAVPNLILVGSPATEAQNLLVTPLAGHEIGHSIWFQKAVGDALNDTIIEAVSKYFDVHPPKLKTAMSSLNGASIDIAQEQVEVSLKRKAEEAFCDIVGLKLFGSAYLFAFEYYMAPGRKHVSNEYPSDIVRINILKQSARIYDIPTPTDIFEGWEEPAIQRGANALYEIADIILSNCVSEILKIVDTIFKEADIESPREEKISEVLESFDRYEPYGGEAWFSEIVNALWKAASNMNLKNDDASVQFRALTEIALKSVEVSEIQTKVRKYQECS